MPPVAVAVVSYNTRDLLARCLDSLRPEAEAGRARVLVVDNRSSDGSAALVRDRYRWARLIEPEDNLGFGRAVNRAAAEAGEWDWLVCANADVALEPGALDALLAAGEADPQAGIVAPRLLGESGETQESVLPFPTLRSTLTFNVRPHRRWWDPEQPARVPWAIGALLALRRSCWEATGGFDESLFMYAEDLDLGWRAAKAGWHTRYEPSARARHADGAATQQAFADVEVRKQRETYDWIGRRHGRATARAIAAVNIAGAAARIPVTRGWERERWRGWLRTHRQAARRRA